MRWLIIALAIVLLSGCSSIASDSSSGSGEPIPRRDANDLATVRAMAGIEKATPTPRAATPTPTVAPAQDPQATATPDVLSQKGMMVSDAIYFDTLLSPSDIAGDWTFGGFDRINVASFCDAAAIEETFPLIGWAHGSYSAVSGQWAEQWVARLTEAEAQAAMEYARNSLTCDTFTQSSDDAGLSYWDFEPLQLPGLGDDIHAVEVNITWENPIYTPFVGHIVYVRKGEYVIAMMYYGFSIDPAISARMAEVAVARLDLVTDSSV